jgi:2-methylcitrate dehydratase
VDSVKSVTLDNTTAELASFASQLPSADIPADVVIEAKRRIIDTLGCGYGGYTSQPATIARALAGEYTGSGAHAASVLGLGDRSTVDMAAFANAVMIRYQDLNDVNKSLRMGGHPSDMIPAVLAVAEAYGVSGDRAIRGVIAAYQGFGSVPVHIKKLGWDQGLLVAIGVAMGTGVVLGLDEEQIANAISLALTPNIPLCVTRRGELSMWKACASAATGQSAIITTLLAAKGLTGPGRPFEGVHGLHDQVTGAYEAQVDPGQYGYRIAQSDIKLFPSCGSTQAPLATVIDMAAGLSPDDIESIDIETHWDTWFEVGREPEKWDPQSRETADHSMPFVIATAIRDGNVTVRSFSDEAVRSPGLRPLMSRIRISENPELTALRPAETLSDIAITTRSGERRVRRTGIPPGDHRNPLTDAQLENKFRGMAEPLTGEETCTAVLRGLWALDERTDAGTVLRAWSDSVSGA